MDFFNFLYKLSNIFANKRRLKFFIVVGLILLFLFASSKGVFAATPEESEALTNYQLLLQQEAFTYLKNLYNQNLLNASTFNQFKYILTNYHVYVTTSSNPNAQFIVYLYVANAARSDGTNQYNTNDDFTIDGEWSVGILSDGTTSGTAYPCKLANFYGRSFVINRANVEGLDSLVDYGFGYFYIPQPCYLVRSNAVIEFCEYFNLYNEVAPTYSTSDEELQAITSSGFQDLNNSIATTNNELSEANDNLNSINNEVSATNDFLNDTSVDESIVSLPSENNEDVTLGFFTGLLQTFTDNFTSRTIREVEVPIPFTTKKFYINNRFINSLVENNSNFAPIVNLAYAFWWFLLGYYVLIDVYRKINALKSGDLTNIENDNITTDLL